MRILTVVDYDEMWPALFENERTLLQMTLGKVISRIHHIGSTSVPGLSAKPVIDILIEVANLEELDSLNQAMEGIGYTVRGENGILNRRYFTKGGNQRSHHIHAFATGDAQIIKHLAPHLIENSGAPQVRLTDSELREIDAALAKIPLQGGRADPFTESQFDKS
ncbi:putative dehydrogenase [Klebsiella pneumoniae]|nr:putative dehydrogenase [Klebsiella pneumoniae]